MKSFPAMITFDPHYWNVSNGRDSSGHRDVVLGSKGLIRKVINTMDRQRDKSMAGSPRREIRGCGAECGSVLTAF